MDTDRAVRAQLIAIDGVRGRDIERHAEDLRRKLQRKSGVHAGISRWDASGAFYELRAAGRKALTLTPRTLLLVYASDLAFRVRWEIQPALDAGQTVIAAPYVDTAIAFAEGAGLSRRWAAELLRFAPRADMRVSAGASRSIKRSKGRATDGFVEFAALAAKTLGQHTPSKPSKGR
jgi:thymidylate kinase